MPNYRRAFVPGGTFFFTLVTNLRRPLFDNASARALLGKLIRECQTQWPFSVDAIVLLPDHLHAIWSLRPGDTNYSRSWAWIKKEFTKDWLATGGQEAPISHAREMEGRRGVWQPRFWEHTLEDKDDFENHFDYIHYNPVKHDYVLSPKDWLWSSFHRWVRLGVYDVNWGSGETEALKKKFAKIEKSVGEL
jgi:putative transposase